MLSLLGRQRGADGQGRNRRTPDTSTSGTSGTNVTSGGAGDMSGSTAARAGARREARQGGPAPKVLAAAEWPLMQEPEEARRTAAPPLPRPARAVAKGPVARRTAPSR